MVLMLLQAMVQVESNVDQMLHHYSVDGWLTYKEPVQQLSRQTSVGVRFCLPTAQLVVVVCMPLNSPQLAVARAAYKKYAGITQQMHDRA